MSLRGRQVLPTQSGNSDTRKRVRYFSEGDNDECNSVGGAL